MLGNCITLRHWVIIKENLHHCFENTTYPGFLSVTHLLTSIIFNGNFLGKIYRASFLTMYVKLRFV